VSAASIAGRASFDFVRYASVWEDADVLCEALAPVARGGRLLSVASAGDNALALLTLDPAEVVAADLSAAQLACLELRIAAFRRIDDRARLLEFLGAGTTPERPAGDVRNGGEPASDRPARRLALYDRLRADLSPGAAGFWDAHRDSLARGAIHDGKFERYFHLFRRRVLPLIHSRADVARLRAGGSRDERERFYVTRWDSWRWRAMFRLFFSRAMLGRLGRDPEFFAHVQGSVSDRILARSRYALVEIPTESNPYLAYILTGTFREGALPRYLRADAYPTIRSRLDRLRLIQGGVESAPGPFDGMNLSDVFEYMSVAETERCYAALLERARPGARLVYWNMLAPRARPERFADRVRPMASLAAELHARDRAWFYSALHVDEVAA
jgi:S-adenosylmethionine-diacylglycerol 3-amino-3-carboxypropyl transferase